LKCEAWIDEIQRKIAKGEWPSIALEANKNVDLESTVLAQPLWPERRSRFLLDKGYIDRIFRDMKLRI
jgi:hypothetical protein